MKVKIVPGVGIIEPVDGFEHYRAEDGHLYIYCASERWWTRWSGPLAQWITIPDGPSTPAYRIYGEDARCVMEAFDRDFRRRKALEMKGSTSARKTDDGLAVTCRCGEAFTLPAEGGEQTCACGARFSYDGATLRSSPAEAKRG